MVALRIFNALANGTGGLDWAALPLFAALHTVQDLEPLIDRLLVIKTHKPPTSPGL